MRALVTGAQGFVGPFLVQHLRSHGDEVIETDRTMGLDIGDPVGLAELFGATRAEVIYHLAGDADVGGSWTHPLETFRANAEGTLNVLQAAREAGAQRVVSISSADVYGKVSEDELPLTEESPLRPTSPYAASKVAAEFLGVQAMHGYGLEVIRVRSFNHLGPGQSERFVAPGIAMRIARAERQGTSTIPVDNLTPRRDLTDVRDVVRAYRLLALHGAGGEVYNVCSGSDRSIESLAEDLIAQARIPMTLVPDSDLQRPVDIPVLRGDNTKLRTATGWSPEIPISQSLSDLLASCRALVESQN